MSMRTRSIRSWALNSTSLNQPEYAVPDDQSSFDDDGTGPILEGGGGGGADDELDLGDFDFDGGDESQDQDEINGDEDDFLAQFYKPGKDEEDDDSDDDDDEDAGDSPEAQQALAKGITDGIAALTIPDEAIPENFDPTDRKALRELLATVQKDTVQQTMKIMWNPIAAALKQTHVRMRQEWRQGINQGVTGSQRQQLLDKAIPHNQSPGVRDVVNQLMKRAEKKFPKDIRSQVLSTRKAMLALGMRIPAPGSMKNGGNKQQNRPSRTGSKGVLDAFAKLPEAAFGNGQSRGNANQRLANRLKK